MFQGCTTFNQSISGIHWAVIKNYRDFLKDTPSFVIEYHVSSVLMYHLKVQPKLLFGTDHPFAQTSNLLNEQMLLVHQVFDEENEQDDSLPLYTEELDRLRSLTCPDHLAQLTEEDVKCAICWSTISCPLHVQCGCTFCVVCWHRHTLQATEDEDGITILCPCCRSSDFGIIDTNVDFELESVIELYWKRVLQTESALQHQQAARLWIYRTELSREFLFLIKYSYYQMLLPVSSLGNYSRMEELPKDILLKYCIQEIKEGGNVREVIEEEDWLDDSAYIEDPMELYYSLQPLFAGEIKFDSSHPQWNDFQFTVKAFVLGCLHELLKEKLKDAADISEYYALMDACPSLRFPIVLELGVTIRQLKHRHPEIFRCIVQLVFADIIQKREEIADDLPVDSSNKPKRPILIGCCPLCDKVIASAHWLLCCGRSVCYECIVRAFQAKRDLCAPTFPCPCCGFQDCALKPIFVQPNRKLEQLIEASMHTDAEWMMRKAFAKKMMQFAESSHDHFGGTFQAGSMRFVFSTLYKYMTGEEEEGLKFRTGVSIKEVMNVFRDCLDIEEKKRLYLKVGM